MTYGLQVFLLIRKHGSVQGILYLWFCLGNRRASMLGLFIKLRSIWVVNLLDITVATLVPVSAICF